MMDSHRLSSRGGTGNQGQGVKVTTQKITLELPEELVKKVKITAIERGLKMRELIEEALVSYLG